MFGYVQVGCLVYVDMVVFDVGFDGGYLGIVYDCFDQVCFFVWNYYIDQVVGLNQVSDGGVVGS